jgi:hypothetical protein
MNHFCFWCGGSLHFTPVVKHTVGGVDKDFHDGVRNCLKKYLRWKAGTYYERRSSFGCFIH